MYWFIIISLILIAILLWLGWKFNVSTWIILAFAVLAGTSAYAGRWHYYFEPLHYEHVLAVSVAAKNDLKKSVTDYNKHDSGFFINMHPIKHHELSSTSETASDRLKDLKQFKVPANISNYSSKVKARKDTIRGLQYQLNRDKKLENKLSY